MCEVSVLHLEEGTSGVLHASANSQTLMSSEKLQRLSCLLCEPISQLCFTHIKIEKMRRGYGRVGVVGGICIENNV